MAAELFVDEALTKAGQWGPSQRKYFLMIQLAHLCFSLHMFASSYVDYEPRWTCVRSVQYHRSFRHLDSNLTVVENRRKTIACEAYDNGLCSPQFAGTVTSTVTEVTSCLQ